MSKSRESYLRFPRRLRDNNYIKSMAYKSGEPLELCVGRLMLFIDYATRRNRERYDIDEVNLMTGWNRTDLTFAEVLEYAKLVKIENGRINLTLPKEFCNPFGPSLGGKARKAQGRDQHGRFLPKQTSISKPSEDAPRNQLKDRSPEPKKTSLSTVEHDGLKLAAEPPSPPLFPPLSPLSDSPPYLPPIIPPLPPFSDTQKLVGFQAPLRKGSRKTSERAIEERREINKFWREQYENFFGHAYPQPPNARYNAEIKRIHDSLGLVEAKEKLLVYLAWRDPYVVKEGHPIEFFMMKLVKMESDRARHEKKLEAAAHADALRKNITKRSEAKTEVQLAYEDIKRREREGNPRNMSEGTGDVQVSTESHIHSKLGDRTEQGKPDRRDVGVPVQTVGKDSRSIPISGTVVRDFEGRQGERKVQGTAPDVIDIGSENHEE